METNIQHAQNKQQSDNVQVATYRIIQVIPKEVTIQLVPKLEIGDFSNQNVGDNVTLTTLVIDKDSSVKQHSQESHVPVDLTGHQHKSVHNSANYGSESYDQKFFCLECKKAFKFNSHFKRHMNNIHSGKLPTHKCDLCGKTFYDYSTLYRHRKIHFGDELWTCEICNRSFNTLGSLRRHVTIHNPDERPYQCETCSKRFPDGSSLQKHKLIHTGIKSHVCTTCGKAFIGISELNAHCKIHVDVKPYNCENCGKDFAKHSNYTRHRRIHEGEREFVCSVCGVSYNYQSSLTRHVLTHVQKSKKRGRSTKAADSNNTLSKDNSDADFKHKASLEGGKSGSDLCENNVLKVTGIKNKYFNEIKHLNSLKGRKSEKQNTSDQNSNPNVSGEAFEDLDCDENDPTLLPRQDETLSKQITTEDESSLLNVPDDFGSTKVISAPLLLIPKFETIYTFSSDPLNYNSSFNEEDHVLSSNEPGLSYDSDGVTAEAKPDKTILSFSDQAAVDNDLGISGIENINVLAVKDDPDKTAETIVPDAIS